MASMMSELRDVEQLLADTSSGDEEATLARTPSAPNPGRAAAVGVIAVVALCAFAAAGHSMERFKVGSALVSAVGSPGQPTPSPIQIKGKRELEDGLVNGEVPAPTLSEHAASCLKIALEFAEQAEEKGKADGVIMDPSVAEEEKEFRENHGFAKAESEIDSKSWENDHEAVLEALELYEKSVTPEEAMEAGCVITDTVMEEIMGLPGTPESASGAEGASSMTIQGDMVGRDDSQVRELRKLVDGGKTWGGTLWEDPRDIKYCFQSSISSESRSAALEAIQHFENMVPCLNFRKVDVESDSEKACAEQPAIYIQSSESGCWANIGQPWHHQDKYGQSIMNLGETCDELGVAAHELGHNLGMLHEQSRTDSPKYVQILWDNIQPDAVKEYDFSDKADRSLPYDILSLMHYGDHDFGRYKNGERMQTMKSTGVQVSVMGNRMGLTLQDSKQLGEMYGCSHEIEHFMLCTPDPLGCTKEDCGCHQNQSAANDIIKTTDDEGCHRCLPECPAAPTGSPAACGCPAGMDKTSFTSDGKEYYSCKAEPSPTPAPEPGDNSSSQCKPDKEWWCKDHAGEHNCHRGYMINNLPVLDNCATTCGRCDPDGCWDEFSNCGEHATYCDSTGATMEGMDFEDACPKTCGKCGQ